MATNRYTGECPAIGIRPIIDGRRGPLKVRESLEDQTMAMAQAAKKLFEENIFYSNGEPVKVVIADTTIGRVAEAAACAVWLHGRAGDLAAEELTAYAMTPTDLLGRLPAAFKELED